MEVVILLDLKLINCMDGSILFNEKVKRNNPPPDVGRVSRPSLKKCRNAGGAPRDFSVFSNALA